MRRNLVSAGFALLAIVPFALHCGKKSDDSPAPIRPSPGGTESQLAVAYPMGLALSAFPRTVASASLTDEAIPEDKTIPEKVAEAEALVNGEAASCVPESLKKALRQERSVTCYEFDHDMIRTKQVRGLQTQIIGTTDGTDGQGEACMVSFARSKVELVVDIVDRTMGMIQMMMCQAKKNDTNVSLPQQVGATLDLKAAVTAALTGDRGYSGRATVTAASIERLPDIEGRPVYRNAINITEPSGIERTIRVVHSPKSDEDNSEFNGTLWTAVKGEPAPAPGLVGQTGKTRGLSIVYRRTQSGGEPRVQYELRSGRFAPDLEPYMFKDSGVLDLNANAKFDVAASDAKYGRYQRADGSLFCEQLQAGHCPGENDAVDGITYVAFDVNPDTNAGDLAYWQNPGGGYDENARGLVFSLLKNDESGTLAGCASSGAASTDFTSGLSIRKMLHLREEGPLADANELKPRGYWHPFLHGGTPTSTEPGFDYTAQRNSPQGDITLFWAKPLLANSARATQFAEDNDGSLTTKQCFKQDDVSGKYEIDTALTPGAAGYLLLDSGVGSEVSEIVKGPPVDGIEMFEGDIKD